MNVALSCLHLTPDSHFSGVYLSQFMKANEIYREEISNVNQSVILKFLSQ